MPRRSYALQRALAELPSESQATLDTLAQDYLDAAEKRVGMKVAHYGILADLVRAGWCKRAGFHVSVHPSGGIREKDVFS